MKFKIKEKATEPHIMDVKIVVEGRKEDVKKVLQLWINKL